MNIFKKTNQKRFALRDSKGFTLIELLVVIAIIGILAGITLAVLNNARTKARDSEVKGMMDQMRKQAEIYYSINGDYGAATFGYCQNAISASINNANNRNTFGVNLEEGIYPILNEIMDTIPDRQNVVDATTNANINIACYSGPNGSPNAQRWAVRIGLPSRSPWCVDSTGYAGPASTIASHACVPS